MNPIRSLKRMEPVPFGQVTIHDAFWAPRLATNRRVTLPIEYEQCRKTGRIDAFRLDWKPGRPNKPHYFWDSDLAKWVEAAAYSLAERPDRRLEAKLEGVIDLVVRAQYDLPNESGYAETCAAIGLAMFAQRMLALDLDGSYGDAMERVLYSGVLSGVSLDGRFAPAEAHCMQGPLNPIVAAVGAAANSKKNNSHKHCHSGHLCLPYNVTTRVNSIHERPVPGGNHT